MRRAIVAVIVAAICCPALVSCGHDEAAGPQGSPPTSPVPADPPTSSPPTTPSDGSTATPPQMPALARQKSEAGAKAFVKYYIAVLNYAWTAESGDQVRNLSLNRCKLCQGLAKFVDSVTRHGGFQSGGEWSVINATLVPGQPLDLPIVLPTIHVAKGKWRRSAQAAITRIQPHNIRYEFFLSWDTGWSIKKMTT
jgi:hypothetical protein